MELQELNRALGERYALEREVGRGGAATVYLAQDRKHRRPVALKVLHPEVAAAVGAGRFLAEIRIAAGLGHPHILPVHDSGRAGSLLYYVMPYVEGPTLRDRLAHERQLPLGESLRIASEIAEGLACAHRHGVIHRDVKPENVLFYEGHAALTDFGIAQRARRAPDDPNTDPGIALGTPEYMSPEACEGRPLDARADEYSLACVIYEMLAGGPPFTAASPELVAARHACDEVPPLARARPDVPEEVAAVVMQALAKDPQARYPTLEAFADALREAAANAEAAAARAVAVLPFVDPGGPPEDAALREGIADEIAAALARVEGLRVASRSAVEALKAQGRGDRQIAAQLHVGALLEGSVRRSGSRIRVAVQLVQVHDGRLLWSERYDRDLADVFAIQDEIASSVARGLQLVLRPAERTARPPTGSVGAYEYYLRGRQYFRRANRRSLAFAQEMFQRAISADPGYALAWAGIADCCSLLHMFYPDSESDLLLGDQASARALALAPDLAEAHGARAFALWQLGREAEAIDEFETSIRLDPFVYETRYHYGRLRFTRGEMAQAAEQFLAAAQAREDHDAQFFAAQALAALGRGPEAEAAYRRAYTVARDHVSLNPDDARAATMCAVAACRLGDRAEGLSWAERARRIQPDDAGVMYNVACLYSLEGEVDTAFACLEQAMQAGFGHRDWIAHDPDLDALRKDPRFKVVARG